MSRDSHGAKESWQALNVATKTRDGEYSIPGVFGSTFKTHQRSVAP
jgi:hypothetical protein